MSIQADRSRVTTRALRAVADWVLADDLNPELFRSFARAVIERVRGGFLLQQPAKGLQRVLEEAWRRVSTPSLELLKVDIVCEPQRRTLVITHMADQPFIIDTVRLYLRRSKADIYSGFNVVLRVTRDANGAVVGIGGEEGALESVAVQEIEVGGLLDDRLEAARSTLRKHLELVQATTRDFKPMIRLLERAEERCHLLAERYPGGDGQAARAEGLRETAAFLSWLLRENFVFMGVRTGDLRLGIETLTSEYGYVPGRPWSIAHPPGTVWVRKSERESPIHREGRIDEVRVQVDPDGEEIIIRGMFTYRAVTQPSRGVPILRNVLRDYLTEEKAVPGSFRFKGIANVFDSLPTEFLFTAPSASIAPMIDLVLDSDQRSEAAVHVDTYADGSAFCLVSLPRGLYSEDLRRHIEAEVRGRLKPTYVDHGLFIGRFETVLLHYYLTGLPTPSNAVKEQFGASIRALATPWEDRLWAAIEARLGEPQADDAVGRWGSAFPERYQLTNTAARADADIERMEAMGDARLAVDLYEEDGHVRLRLFQRQNATLTHLLPLLDHFGLIVISSEALVVAGPDGAVHIDTFDLSLTAAERERLFAAKDRLLTAIPAVYDQVVEDDELNELVITGGLGWTEVDVLRSYSAYLRQLQFPLPVARVRAILLSQPGACAALITLFKARFDPGAAEGRAAAIGAAEAALQERFRHAATHDEAQLLSAMIGLVQATLRTNAWRADRVSHYLSFKFDCARIREMKPEKPLYEIFVFSRDVEGVHLRFGKVARGGIRWSDRGDYRTEVLGLVTTQQVKNVVIVPEGSKGGFLLHYPETDPAALRKQADQLYQTFIRGLLDLTDNVVRGAQISPPGVVVHDAFDPYLVVAADKGTAHLSDTANGLSLAYGFWLGDAFASGGSNGYDHKKVGITARGAWVLVRRHFAELGRDPYKEPFTCVGVGDMGGDVFGNGLIETPHTRLLAAFNHQHVFLDPNPDTARSYEERVRLFKAERLGGWGYYDPSVISEGGGVFERKARSIRLSPQAQAMLGISEAEPDPETVIRAILMMDVDLLWSGGIGTYVKATHETQEDADDRTNDRARVNATDLRCRIVGEGANLSFTQAARIQANLLGVRMNTDFIDNSAGVDLSDHEVNLKILLAGPVSRGALTEEARNTLLEGLTDEVARLVLVDNDTQGRQISRDRARSTEDIFPYGRAIAFIERYFKRTRESFQLPSDEELAERARKKQGLSRPELATLSSHVKRYVFSELMASGRAREITGYRELLLNYFPVAISRDFLADVEGHQLADEIAMTMVTTRVVADAGAAFIPLAVESTGRSVFSVCNAYLKAQRLARTDEVRSTLEELRTSVRLDALTRAWVQVDAGCREVALFWLSSGTRPPTDAEVAEMSQAVNEVYELQADEVAAGNAEVVERMRQDDIPERVSMLVLKAQYLNIALMVWWHARKLGVGFRETVVRQLAVGRVSRLQAIIDALGRRPTSGQWEPIAMRILVNRFTDHLRQLVLRAGTEAPANSVEELEPHFATGPVADVRSQVDRLMPAGAPIDLPALLVLEERLAVAITRMGT